jgi:hypothetical protein
MDTKEEWRDVVGFEGKYRVSSHGRVWSNRKKKYMTPWVNSRGYALVVLRVDGKNYPRKVHRLVMEAFSEDFSEDLQVNHKDENKLNNMLSNLEMCTHQYNSEYSLAKHYIVTTPDGEEIEVFNMRKFCRENNLHVGHMTSVVTGNLDHHKGYKARYKE